MPQSVSGASAFGVFKAPLEAASSAPFATEVDALRRLASAPHPRTTGALAELTWAQLGQKLDENRRAGPRRPRAHRDFDVDREDGLSHVGDYMARCRRVARRYLHSAAAAELVHEEVRCGDVIRRAASSELLPTATGARASSLAADITGAPWGAGATSLAESRRQWVGPRADEYLAAYKAEFPDCPAAPPAPQEKPRG